MFKIALCQMPVAESKRENVAKARAMAAQAADNGAAMVALPEMFNCPYGAKYFPEYAEQGEGETFLALSAIAKELGVVLIGGSIPEREGESVFNTCYCFDERGGLLARHRKTHLYDIDAPGRIRFFESDTLAAGSDVTVFDTSLGRVGVAICYDARFPEMMRLQALRGAKIIVLPAQFNMVTGPVHWEMTLRARALDNQVYFAGVSCARDMEFTYNAYGHSAVASPWGEIVSMADERETIVYADIDLDYVDRIRNELPLLAHRRTDLYEVRHV